MLGDKADRSSSFHQRTAEIPPESGNFEVIEIHASLDGSAFVRANGHTVLSKCIALLVAPGEPGDDRQ